MLAGGDTSQACRASPYRQFTVARTCDAGNPDIPVGRREVAQDGGARVPGYLQELRSEDPAVR
jgi:hypothetical protein